MSIQVFVKYPQELVMLIIKKNKGSDFLMIPCIFSIYV